MGGRGVVAVFLISSSSSKPACAALPPPSRVPEGVCVRITLGQDHVRWSGDYHQSECCEVKRLGKDRESDL